MRHALIIIYGSVMRHSVLVLIMRIYAPYIWEQRLVTTLASRLEKRCVIDDRGRSFLFQHQSQVLHAIVDTSLYAIILLFFAYVCFLLVRTSGYIINTPGWVDGQGLQLLHHYIDAFGGTSTFWVQVMCIFDTVLIPPFYI